MNPAPQNQTVRETTGDSGKYDPTIALRNFIITGYGKDPVSDFTDKNLGGLVVSNRGKPRHYYSSAYNQMAKMVRFHVHISQFEGEAPVLWLARNRYKTCRATNQVFYTSLMELKDGQWTAVWKMMTFRVLEGFDYVQVDAFNNSDEFDFWTMTQPGAKSTERLTLTQGGRNQPRRRSSPDAYTFDDEDAPF